jgi:hypothetical protein
MSIAVGSLQGNEAAMLLANDDASTSGAETSPSPRKPESKIAAAGGQTLVATDSVSLSPAAQALLVQTSSSSVRLPSNVPARTDLFVSDGALSAIPASSGWVVETGISSATGQPVFFQFGVIVASNASDGAASDADNIMMARMADGTIEVQATLGTTLGNTQIAMTEDITITPNGVMSTSSQDMAGSASLDTDGAHGGVVEWKDLQIEATSQEEVMTEWQGGAAQGIPTLNGFASVTVQWQLPASLTSSKPSMSQQDIALRLLQVDETSVSRPRLRQQPGSSAFSPAAAASSPHIMAVV